MSDDQVKAGLVVKASPSVRALAVILIVLGVGMLTWQVRIDASGIRYGSYPKRQISADRSPSFDVELDRV